MQLTPGIFEKNREQFVQEYERSTWPPLNAPTEEELDAQIRSLYASLLAEQTPFQVIRARILACALENCPIQATAFDPFAHICHHPREIMKIRNERYLEIPRQKMTPGHFTDDRSICEGLYFAHLDLSHTTPDWDNILNLGITGLLQRAESQLEENPSPFAESVVIVYRALHALARRFSEAARQIGNAEAADTAEALLHHPPQTLLQALELGLLYREVQEIEGEPVRSMGLFDRQYRPFYEADIASGRLTEDEAEELLCIYFARFHAESRGKLMGTPFCFGGLLPDGSDGCCELTRLAWNAFRRVGMVDPKFSIRVNHWTPDSQLRQIAECIKSGKNAVLFANEELARTMFLRHGKEECDLVNFVPVGCYEPAIMGKELSCTMAGMFNFAKVAELLLADSRFQPKDFEEFFEEYLARLRQALAETMERIGEWERLWNDINPAPLLSGTMDECMTRHLDVSQYGSKYATSGIMCAGIGTATDAVAAVRDLVFERKLVTYDELRAILDADWANAENLRLEAKYRSPKWGCGNEAADAFAVRIVNTAAHEIEKTPNVKGGFYQMGLWSIDWIRYFGLRTGATADGRHSGEFISKNVGSTVGCDSNGLSGLISSVTRLDHTHFANGTVLDVMLPPRTVAGPDGADYIIRIVRGFFASGGLFIHFNILAPEELRAAQNEPEKYRNLQIRLCGWNVRFIDLDRPMQDCLIREAEGRRE